MSEMTTPSQVELDPIRLAAELLAIREISVLLLADHFKQTGDPGDAAWRLMQCAASVRVPEQDGQIAEAHRDALEGLIQDAERYAIATLSEGPGKSSKPSGR